MSVQVLGNWDTFLPFVNTTQCPEWNSLNEVSRSEGLEGKVEEGNFSRTRVERLALGVSVSAIRLAVGKVFPVVRLALRQTFSAIRLAIIQDHVTITVINKHHVPFLI